MPQDVYKNELLGNMVLAVKLENEEHLAHAHINDLRIAAYYEAEGYAYIYLPELKRKVYTFTYSIGSHKMSTFVENTGTYNVYDFSTNLDKISVDLRMYGTQDVVIKCPQPDTVYSDNPYLQILEKSYNKKSGYLTLKVYGRDMQGERGLIRIERFQISD